jgi:uncharacterized protein YkwD
MHKIYLGTFTFLISIHLVCAQSNEYLYTKVDYNNFREYKPFSKVIVFEDIDYKLMHAAIFHATNEIRNKRKLSILTYHKLLEEAAVLHAKDMVKDNFFSHTNAKSKKKRTPNDRGALVGIPNPYIAENIAEAFGIQYKSNTKVYIQGEQKFSYTVDGPVIPPHTYLTFADYVLESWMNSKGHRENILSKHALQLGCGAYYYTHTNFNDMPSFKVVQNFQWYVKLNN